MTFVESPYVLLEGTFSPRKSGETHDSDLKVKSLAEFMVSEEEKETPRCLFQGRDWTLRQ